ncbi:N-acetyltransferase [Levilactobacillus brevis]|uniref:GNAT family N-acetyltransferase n=1 Tax=Levilactobacillus brevis TaxID=1580 RepID=UPI0011195912|nr:GNAT family N-acetyltransferase [Levilactobacillus brevis]QCZ46836.1 hypothetical protein UCCLB556_1961 [Levilactobacillus brevis]
MEVTIKQLEKKDFNSARKFAVEGMHLNWYTANSIELFLYSKYFWNIEIEKATNAYGAYLDGKLEGVLLADMSGEPKMFRSIGRKLFIKISDWFIGMFYGKMTGEYDDANREMLSELYQKTIPDGELNFFAVNPQIKGKGIGTQLLDKFASDEKGKFIYLYTDSGSTYQFYLHRDFKQKGQKEIKLSKANKTVDLTCYLFSKVL